MSILQNAAFAKEGAQNKDLRTWADLPLREQEFWAKVFAGEKQPPLYTDTIAKNVFSADVHPDRLNFLLRGIAKDESINVVSSASNENFPLSLHAKTTITDIPAWLAQGRRADLEIQKAQQEYIFTRTEIYASHMLLVQYSVEDGQAKSEVDYRNVKDVLVVVLMVESPKVFREFDKCSRHYIHRFVQMVSDTGLAVPCKAKTIYVQLDKCLQQFQEDRNAESEDDRPDRLQAWLSAIADSNDLKVREAVVADSTLQAVSTEAFHMTQNKEVQGMILQEKLDRMDFLSYMEQFKDEGRREGKAEGIVEGADKEREKSIRVLIDALRDFGAGEDAIVDRLMRDYSLSREQAESKVTNPSSGGEK